MAVDDHGLEVLKKSGEEVVPNDKSDYFIKVNDSNVESVLEELPKLPTSATTTLVPVGSASEVEISPVVGQVKAILTIVGVGTIHFSRQTGVSTSNANVKRDEQITINGETSIFLIKSSSAAIDVQVDREIAI